MPQDTWYDDFAPASYPAQSAPKHMRPRHDRRRLGALVVAGTVVVVLAAGISQIIPRSADRSGTGSGEGDLPGDTTPADEGNPGGAATGEPDGAGEDGDGSSPAPEEPASGFDTPGLLTFRGSPGRNYHGSGPVPEDPEVLWSYPNSGDGMCGMSTVGSETTQWCGTGWTGQPAVFEREGRTWVVFGAYDHQIHFVDFATGQDIIPPFPTGDIIKGSVTIDPDGYPLVYSGSRDDKMRVIAFDGEEPEELWALHAEDVSPTMWNNDWDSSPLVIDDFLYEGGENSQFHAVRLNRSYGDDGKVQVAPELAFNAPGWDDQLLADLNAAGAESPNNLSIENSVAFHDGVVYFANSGGLVQGWDVSGLAEGVEPTRVFRFWNGDDTDASVVVDDDGFLYVASEYERSVPRADEVGTVMKLDPSAPDDPLVWSFHDPSPTVPRGHWATPALYEDLVIVPSHAGVVYGIDRTTGDTRWEIDRGNQTWSSPAIVDDTLIQTSCDEAVKAYDLSDTSTAPPELWSVSLNGCIESTPAVWDGRIFVGTRGGLLYAIGDP